MSVLIGQSSRVQRVGQFIVKQPVKRVILKHEGVGPPGPPGTGLGNVNEGVIFGREVGAGLGVPHALTPAQARTVLELGGAAVLNVGTSVGTVAAGDDSRFSYTPAGTGGVTRTLRARAADGEHSPIDWGGIGNGIANDAQPLTRGLTLGYTMTLQSQYQWLFNPDAGQAATIVANFSNINSEELNTITFPEMEYSVSSGDIMEVGPEGRNLRLIGATPLLMMLEADPSTGTAVEWTGSSANVLATYRVASIDPSMQVGHYAKLFRVGPHALLFGDDQAVNILRGRLLPGELCNPFVTCGGISGIQSTGSATFSTPSYGTVSIAIRPQGTCTFTIGSADIARTAHGYSAGNAIYFTTTGALPTGFTVNTIYYVIATGLTANVFRVSATPGGSAIVATGSDSGTHTVLAPAVFTRSNHLFTDDFVVYITTAGALPTGVAASTKYFVSAINRTANTFLLAATAGGLPIVASGSQSGTHTIFQAVNNFIRLNDLLHVKANTVRVTGYSGLNGVTISPGWSAPSFGLSSFPALGTYGLTIMSTGVIQTSGSTATITGIGTLAQRQACLGGLCVFLGEAVEIIEILSDTSFRLARAVNIPATSATCTITSANPGVVTRASHGLAVGAIVYFTTTGTLPAGLSPNTPYFVLSSGLTTNDFQVSATLNGTAIDTSASAGSGTHTLVIATPFSFIVPGSAHDGGGRIMAIDVPNKKITVQRRFRLPVISGDYDVVGGVPDKMITYGEFRVLRTILKNTGPGDGLKFTQGGGIGYLDNMAIVGGRNSTDTIGVALTGRISAGVFGSYTQHGYVADALLGENVLFVDWGHSAYVGGNAGLDARGVAFDGAESLDLWCDSGGYMNLRRATSNGAGGTALQCAGEAIVTEFRSFFGQSDGQRREAGGRMYGEAPMSGLNLGMDYRLFGGDGDLKHAISWAARQSSVYAANCDTSIDGFMGLGARRQALEMDGPGDLSINDSWFSGVGSTSPTDHGRGIWAVNGARAVGQHVGISGCKQIGVSTGAPGTEVILPYAYVRRNTGRSAKADTQSYINLRNASFDGAEIANAGRIEHPGATVSSSPAGIARNNEQDVLGGYIRDGVGTASGFTAVRIQDGGRVLFLKKVEVSQVIPSINADDSFEFDAALPGVLTNSYAGFCNCNNIPDDEDVSVGIPAADTLRFKVKNNSNATISSPGNATFTAIVFGMGS